MTSKERILAAWEGRPADYVPLTTWCFGLSVPPHVSWKRDGKPVSYWYSKRMEHLHTLPEAWTLEDDFKRVMAWRSLGVDDLLDVSVPWSVDADVTWQDSVLPAGEADVCPVIVREYETRDGSLRHAVRQTGEDPGEGWVIQARNVPLMEDYNIPRAVRHAVTCRDDVVKVRHLLQGPDADGRKWFTERMERVKTFAEENEVAVQAWPAFGMDGVVWLAGTENAIMMAMDDPEAFGKLLDVVHESDLGRVELAASTPGVDLICERGWYSSTDFWSPSLFDEFLFSRIRELADVTHKGGKKFGYVMTTGVEILGTRLADVGVDVLYFVDPVQDSITLEKAKELLGERVTLVGGTNALSLASGDPGRIRTEVREALETLAPTDRFILHPVDAIFPDTPWEGVETLIDSWKHYR